VARRILWGTLALTPVVLLARYVFHVGATAQFILAAAALIPLAWLIGEATDKAAAHTGPGVGGFLNASFGNAPELIIALFAVADGLPLVVRGSLAGSIVSNLLLVLGAAMFFGGDGNVDARSLRWQLFALLGGVALLLIPSVPSWSSGDPNTHALFVATIPVAIVLLLVYAWVTVSNLRIHSEAFHADPGERAWSLRLALVVLGVATMATALVSEALVHSLQAFGEAVGLSEFFIAIVIVALVGNAAEHGGAIVIASRGNTRLATEIAVTSSMQVALLVAPAVALISVFLANNLTLAFRPVEMATMAGAGALAYLVTRDGRSSRMNGVLLAGAYGVAVAAYALFP
jgi:Ca2+:H+ antiporter